MTLELEANSECSAATRTKAAMQPSSCHIEIVSYVLTNASVNTEAEASLGLFRFLLDSAVLSGINFMPKTQKKDTEENYTQLL